MSNLTKEELEKFKSIKPGEFLKEESIEIDDEPIVKKDDEPIIKKDEEKSTPARQLKAELEKVKKERDDLNKRLLEAESKSGIVSELEPLKPIAEYLKTKEGKVDEEAVNKLIERNRSRKKELAEREQSLKNKDQKLKEISIESSDEWREEYLNPINEARNTLVASIVNFDKDGNVRNPELMQELMSSIVRVDDKGTPLTSIQVKAEIKKFAEKYESLTGLEYDLPSLREVTDSISTFHKKVISASKAKTDWEQSVTQRKNERLFEQEQKSKLLRDKEIAARDYYFNEYMDTVDKEVIKDVLGTDQEFLHAAEDEHNYLKNMLSGNGTPRNYNDFIDLAAKGKMFDSLVTEINKLKDELKEIKKDEKGPRFNRGGRPEQPKETGIKPTKSYNPTGFLNQ